MPIEIVAPTIVRFSFHGTVAGGHRADMIADISVDEIASTRHDAVLDVVPMIRDAFQNNIMHCCGNSYTFIGGHYTDLDSLGGVSGDFAPNGSISAIGGITNAQMAPNVSYLLKKSCSHTRRQRPGRMYVPAVDEGAVGNDGVISGALLTAINANAASFKTACTLGTGLPHPSTTAWRVVHIEGYDGVPIPGYPLGLPNAWSSSDVSSAVFDSKVATQRRRLR